MPRVAVENSDRISLRVKPQVKAMLVRAAALAHTDLTDFVIRQAISQAEAVIEQAERISLSQRDSERVLALLDNPPKPGKKLLAAAAALPGE